MADKNIGYGVMSTGLQAASTGASIGSVIPGVGTAIGAGVGLVVGGLAGGLQANKQYKELKKMEKEQKKQEMKVKDDAQAYGRRDYYQNTQPPMELDLEVNEPYLSSYDKFKQTTYGA
tara:strand:+ start:3254 stop:3607 length:354 start_codon:yes stop_codon:yes gene_type:complete